VLTWPAIDLETNGVRLRVYRTGRPGAPPVVLVHGLTDNAHYWARTVDVLAPDYDLVLYDARGHGQSGPAPELFDEDTRVTDLLAVVAALDLARPALIGHSMGAATVAVAAARQPGLARGVVLEDPPWVDGQLPEEMRRAYMANWKSDLVALQSLPRAEGLAQRRIEQPDWSEADYPLSLEARLQVDPRVLDFYQLAHTSWREVAVAIDCPLLLLTGEPARGAYVTADLAGEVTRLARAGRWVHCAGASHSVRFSRFDDYLAAVLPFLRDL
jgi:pimeloyl-ACP methyl ester carboxylesterase